MRIVHYGLRSPAITALRAASLTVGTDAGVELLVQSVPNPDVFRAVSPNAAMAVVDLQHLLISDVVPLVKEVLLVSPFTRITVVNTLLTRAQEQTLLFELGKISVGELLDGERCLQAGMWKYLLEEVTGLDVLRDFFRVLRTIVPTDARAPLILDMARYAHVSSVKQLVLRLYPDDNSSDVTKRHKLWTRCTELGLVSPEEVLDALRLLLLKVLLDQGRWSTDRIATYMGHGTPKNLSRSCRTRYGLGVAALKKMTLNPIELAVGAVFWDSQPLSFRPNQDVPFSNQDVL